MNSTQGSPLVSQSGQWLGGNAAAVLQATQAGKGAALLQLSNPRYNAYTCTLTFTVRFPHAPWPVRLDAQMPE